MLFEDCGSNSPQDKLALEVYNLRTKNMASSRSSENYYDTEVKISCRDKWIEFYPPANTNKVLRLFSPKGLFEEKVDILMIKKYYHLPEMLIQYTDGSIESFVDVHYKIEVEDARDA